MNSSLAKPITGPNGSGQINSITGDCRAVLCNDGTVSYKSGDRLTKIDDREAFRNISIATPYLELIEEMTSTELLNFHSTLKLLLPVEDILAAVNPQRCCPQTNPLFHQQWYETKVKLAQAFSVIQLFCCWRALHQPRPGRNCSLQKLVAERTAGRLLIISSNDKNEYDFCNEVISISDYKK